ncbi:glycine cleavage system protein H [Thermomicrobium sp. 4228-Ro]|uniref:glycine cleavage system protein H n=1 Tax=Thermomicrobium sp. 4228-Ro TaxID=2993937 RepID=UPI0022487E68|nr:glycine cleavage system protein H [Thermomicrobium sp. 4228-Ro]MCX2726771.1 glycine cleavage system protein H [Thermomicrobium sp. 4228-Ro]
MSRGTPAYAIVHSCILPLDLFYRVEHHQWVRVETDGVVTLGYTDVAQTVAGRILHVTFRPAGRSYARDATVAVVESAKWLGAFRTPIAGELVETNAALLADPELVNRSPYRRGWLVRMVPEQLERDLAGLLTGQDAVVAYDALMTRRHLDDCVHCEGYELP